VRDNGIGLPEGSDPEQSDSLGLVLVSSLAAQLDGTLQTEQHAGACFTIRFPVPRDDDTLHLGRVESWP